VDDLLTHQMIVISATCKWVRNMFLNLPHEKGDTRRPRDPHRLKHTFDALSYPIYYRRYVRTKGFAPPSQKAAVSVSTN
jgi:hypothetical protein